MTKIELRKEKESKVRMLLCRGVAIVVMSFVNYGGGGQLEISFLLNKYCETS